MKALILAGGPGTRLYPLTLRTPKCLLPIAGKPNIIHLIEMLNNAGINEIYVSINDNQLKINDFLLDKRVNVIIENQSKGKLGSIGGLVYAINKIGNDDLIVLGADNYFKGLDIKEFANNIKTGKAVIALYELPEKQMVEQFGIAVVKDDIITSFQEKPHVDEAKSRLASTLAYGISKEWLEKKLPEYIKNNDNMDTIGSMWQYFAERDELNAFIFKGLWADIGNARAYIDINSKIINKKSIHESAVIKEGTVIKDNVIIESGCVIGKNCVIGPNTHLMRDTTIGEGSVINSSILFENVHIGTKSSINKSIIDGHAIIRDKTRINDYCIVGYKSVIDEGSNLIKGSRVWPFLQARGVIDGNIVPIDEKDDLNKSKYWSDDY